MALPGSPGHYYLGTTKWIYQQTFLDTYVKVAFATLYDRKMLWWPPTCSTTAWLLNSVLLRLVHPSGYSDQHEPEWVEDAWRQ